MRLVTLPDRPAESNIEECVDSAGVILSWRPLPVRPDLRRVAFLGFWLCGWLVSLVYAVFHLLNGESRAFLIFWLGVWTIAGGFALRALWAMLRPALPESVRLEADILQYDSGCRLQRRDKTVIEFARPDLRGVVLERVGERQQLRLNLGGEWLEIGASLREAERKWMFAVLQKWHVAEPDASADGGRDLGS
jgi:hypothetical protein